MTQAQVVITGLAFALMILGGAFLFFQHYSYWRKYGDRDVLIWSIAGVSAALVAVWIIVTRYFLPVTLDSHLVELLALSRRILIVVLFVVFMGIGFREYIRKQ